MVSPSVLDKAANHGVARTLAAVVGAPLVAFAVGAAVVAFSPEAGGLSFALGFHVMVPLWVALACVLPLLKNGKVAWGVCLAILLPITAALALRSAG
ncbi:hypothetical protein MEBOL_001040 [Melittangium boletus DSM 14713]|uniref:Iron uptake protein n=1 Tax=Melittangium boletus DSM 14713 TaxID=1294270 RepID=A0A250I9F4_9BACT|nr:hypothetical protein MEBOL_001040 [Melittangium boletus DSM 14713]